MFGKGPNQASTSGIGDYQKAADQVTASADFIRDTLFETEIEGIHPWQAPDAVHLQLAFATGAYACDRTAELLIEEGEEVKRFKGAVATTDITVFAEFLSAIAAEQLSAAKQTERLAPGDKESIVITEDDAMSLHPENLMPQWPRAYKNGATPLEEGEAQWQFAEQPEVTQPFIKAIIKTAHEFHAHAATELQRLVELPNVPAEGADIAEVLRSIMEEAEEDLSYAEGLALNHDIDADVKSQAYAFAHAGYIKMLVALLGLRTPHIIGPDFFPVRD